nr:hypothetical protein CFP56_36376 [Quercus suber]
MLNSSTRSGGIKACGGLYAARGRAVGHHTDFRPHRLAAAGMGRGNLALPFSRLVSTTSSPKALLAKCRSRRRCGGAYSADGNVKDV